MIFRSGTDWASWSSTARVTGRPFTADGEYISVAGTNVAAFDFADDDGGVDGGFQLVISSVGTQVTVDGGIVWEAPHGNLSVTLAPKTGGATEPAVGIAFF